MFRVVLPLVAIVAVVIGAYVAYQRYLASMRPDDSTRQVSGARLTSERLRTLPSPPWRVAFEIGDDRLGGIDHVLIGPPGVIAITTLVFDRPTEVPNDTGDAQLVAAAALQRGEVDNLLQGIGLSCNMLAKVYWGTPRPDYPAALPGVHGVVAIEGQRLAEWLPTLPQGVLGPAQIDQAWSAVLTGIGRPDPLA